MDLSMLLSMLSVGNSAEEQMTPCASPGSSASSRRKSALKMPPASSIFGLGARAAVGEPTSRRVRFAAEYFLQPFQRGRDAARERNSQQIDKFILIAKQQSRHAERCCGKVQQESNHSAQSGAQADSVGLSDGIITYGIITSDGIITDGIITKQKAARNDCLTC